MMRTLSMFGLQTVLAFGFSGSTALAEPPSTPDPIAEYKKLDEIQKQLADVQKTLIALAEIKKEVLELRTNTNLIIQKAVGDIDKLTQDMAKLRRDVDELRDKVPPQTRTALSPPNPPNSPTMGSIVLENIYSERVSVILNGRSYQLLPGTKRVVDNLPLGTFTYEVLGGPTGVIQPRVERRLTPDKPYEITIFSR